MGIPKEYQGNFFVHTPLEHPYRARTETVQEWRSEKRLFVPIPRRRGSVARLLEKLRHCAGGCMRRWLFDQVSDEENERIGQKTPDFIPIVEVMPGKNFHPS